MAILQEDDWPGNVRELEAVVKRAMVRRRVKWVMPEDITLPRLRRDRAVRASGGILTSLQDLALHLASSRGAVRRSDLVSKYGVSRESARRALHGRERVGVVRREGSGRAVRYVPMSSA
jgi:DNA-binding NtrC family response regulator